MNSGEPTPSFPLLLRSCVVVVLFFATCFGATLLGTGPWGMVIGGVILTGLVVMLIQSAVGGGAEAERHASGNHRFLCPTCLHFHEFQYACSSCRRGVDDFSVWTRGFYGADCAHCGVRLFSKKAAPLLLARCGDCGATAPREIHHERKVWVLAALLPESFTQLAEEIRRSGGHASKSSAFLDDGERLTFVLDFQTLLEKGEIPPEHALHSTSTLWLNGDEAPALELGERIDRLFRRMEADGLPPQRFMVCVGRADAEPAVYNLLAARFAEVRRGCPAPEFFRHGADAGEPV